MLSPSAVLSRRIDTSDPVLTDSNDYTDCDSELTFGGSMTDELSFEEIRYDLEESSLEMKEQRITEVIYSRKMATDKLRARFRARFQDLVKRQREEWADLSRRWRVGHREAVLEDNKNERQTLETAHIFLLCGNFEAAEKVTKGGVGETKHRDQCDRDFQNLMKRLFERHKMELNVLREEFSGEYGLLMEEFNLLGSSVENMYLVDRAENAVKMVDLIMSTPASDGPRRAATRMTRAMTPRTKLRTPVRPRMRVVPNTR
jgi:hypothetical protein